MAYGSVPDLPAIPSSTIPSPAPSATGGGWLSLLSRLGPQGQRPMALQPAFGGGAGGVNVPPVQLGQSGGGFQKLAGMAGMAKLAGLF